MAIKRTKAQTASGASLAVDSYKYKICRCIRKRKVKGSDKIYWYDVHYKLRKVV